MILTLLNDPDAVTVSDDYLFVAVQFLVDKNLLSS